MTRLNLSPDAAEGEAVDPLSEAAGGIDTSFPLLQGDRIYRFECKSAKVAPSKESPDRDTLTIKLVTTKDAKSVQGKDISPGFPIYKRIGVTQTEGSDDRKPRTIDDIRRDLAQVLKAFFGPTTDKTPRQLLNDPTILEGQLVDGRVGVSKDKTGNFPDSNSVTFVLPA